MAYLKLKFVEFMGNANISYYNNLNIIYTIYSAVRKRVQ